MVVSNPIHSAPTGSKDINNKLVFKVAVVALATALINLTPKAAFAEESLTDKVLASLEHYFAAWAAETEEERRHHLEAGWAKDGTYTDPTADVHGREALVQHIGAFASNPQAKNFSIEQASGIDVHHKVLRFAWEMRNAEGKVITPGMDYGEFNDEGKITKIVGFFGPFPKAEE